MMIVICLVELFALAGVLLLLAQKTEEAAEQREEKIRWMTKYIDDVAELRAALEDGMDAGEEDAE
jgi:hypothetical protein